MNAADQKTILLVEDEVAVSVVEQRLLEENGYGCIVAHSGDDAVSLAASAHYQIDLILMDIDLGEGIDGAAAAQAILERRHLPVIFLTGHGDPDYVRRAQAVPHFGYVMKGIGDAPMLEAISTAIRLFDERERPFLQDSLQDNRVAPRIETALEVGNLAWWRMDLPSGKVSFCPRKAEMLGYPPSRFTTYHDFTELLHPEDAERIFEAMRDLVDGRADAYDVEYRLRCSDGAYRWFRDIGAAANRNALSETINVVGFVEEISERKGMEYRLRTALAEKKNLILELNHRVKNNLSIVASLIRLKNRELGESVDLSDIEHRVKAITMIHEKLQESESASQIPFRHYLEDFLGDLFSLYIDGPVIVDITMPEIWFPTRLAVDLGLVVNELATNAMKHGFREGEDHHFSVSLEVAPDADECVLKVSNSGRPFPEDITVDSVSTLGLSIVSTFAHRYRGTLELTRSPHTTFTLRFPRRVIDAEQGQSSPPDRI